MIGGEARTASHVPGWLAREIGALFAEARRRRRRRLVGIAVLLVAGALAGALVTWQFGSGGTSRERGGSLVKGPHRRIAPRWPSFSLPQARVAWFDGNGTLRIGNVASLAQRPLAHLVGSPCCVMVRAGQRIFWAWRHSGRDYIQAYNLATKSLSNVAPGWAVFASADRRDVYVAQSRTRLLRLAVNDSLRPRRLTTPAGWQVVPLPWAVAGGITLSRGPARNAVLGLWVPGAGTVHVIGHGRALATYTGPSGRRGLIAWQPDGCPLQHCPIEITAAPGYRTRAVRSPFRYGFLGQGPDMAFSPDGSQLAAFVSVNKLSPFDSALFNPALVTTRTGAVRLVRRAILSNDELSGWLLWLPGGHRLLVGPARDIARFPGYAINVPTAAVRPFSFFPGPSNYAVNGSSDISDGAVLVSPQGR